MGIVRDEKGEGRWMTPSEWIANGVHGTRFVDQRKQLVTLFNGGRIMWAVMTHRSDNGVSVMAIEHYDGLLRLIAGNESFVIGNSLSTHTVDA